jgi:drug/metabolite transporter (DMT)-like permease
MTRKDGLLALLVVVVWGLNFVVIKVGLHNMPPLMLAGCASYWWLSRRCCLLPVLKSRCVCCSAMA